MTIDVEDLYRRYGPMVLRRCRWILRDEEKALDAMQDTFVQLIRNQEKLHGSYPSSLLYRIATNICFNMLRQDKRHPETFNEELLHSIASHHDIHDQTEARQLLDLLFQDEKEDTRTIATLFFVDGMTLEEVAQASGLSVSGVRKRLRLLKQKAQLREEVQG